MTRIRHDASFAARDPFYIKHYGDHPVYYTRVDDRVAAVRHFNLQQCRVALRQRGLQKTVVDAIERRVRALESPRKRQRTQGGRK